MSRAPMIAATVAAALTASGPVPARRAPHGVGAGARAMLDEARARSAIGPAPGRAG